MSQSSQKFNASCLSLVTSRLSLCILCVLMFQYAQVNGQVGCTTFPCSISIAIYSVNLPTEPLGQSSSVHDLSIRTSTSFSSSSTTSSNIYLSTISSSPLPFSSSSPSTLLSSIWSPASLSSRPSADTSSNTISSDFSPNGPLSTSSPSAVSSRAQISQSPSSAVSSQIFTQIRLPSFSTSSSILPSITSGPSLNSSSTDSTSSTQCGQCSVMANQVQVYYWPTASVKSNCARASATNPYQGDPKYAVHATTNATQSLTALASAGLTDAMNGFTYTFPSTYVSVVGKIHVSNSCGALGKTYTNPTPVAVQAITTASYASWPSECRPQGNYADAVIDTLDIAHIACPTWGLSNPFFTTCNGETYLTATEGPPYNPVILVPDEFLRYDPSWSKCTQVPINGPFLLPCGIYDPPRALNPEGSLQGSQTPAFDNPAPTHLSAEPALAPSPNVAQPTVVPQQRPQTTQIPRPLVQGPETTSNPPSNPNQNQGAGSSGPGGEFNKLPTNPQSPPGSDLWDTVPQPQPLPQTTINLGEQPTRGIGSIINSAFGASGTQLTPQGAGSQGSGGTNIVAGSGMVPGGNQGSPANAAAFTAHAITALGATLSALNPSAVVIGGKTLSVGGPAFTSNGNFYSLGASGSLVAGTLAPGATPPPATALTFAGQTYTANSAGQFIVAGQTLAPGGAITVSGTPILEAAGGAFALVGSSTQLLAHEAAAMLTRAAVMTFDGQTYTADAQGDFTINGQILTPGGVITIYGTPISEANGATDVVIGSSTEVMSTASATQSVMAFEGRGQTVKAPRLTGLLTIMGMLIGFRTLISI